MQQIYRIIPMLKCDFNKVAKQTPLKEILELPNFCHMTIFIAQVEVELCGNVTDITYDFIIFNSKI